VLLDLIPLGGKVLIGDAAFCQRDLSRKIKKKTTAVKLA